MLQETDDVLAPAGLLLHLHVQLAIQRDPADSRQAIVSQKVPDDRRLTSGRIGAQDGRQQIEARLVHPDQRAPFRYGLFLISGQRSSCQRWMASSLRCVARLTGFCTVQPHARSKSPMCCGV